MIFEWFRVYVEDGVARIGPVAVDQNCQGRGIGKLLLDFAEGFASTSQLEVVSCKSDLLAMYARRGYERVDVKPIREMAPRSKLAETDLNFIILRKQNISTSS